MKICQQHLAKEISINSLSLGYFELHLILLSSIVVVVFQVFMVELSAILTYFYFVCSIMAKQIPLYLWIQPFTMVYLPMLVASELFFFCFLVRYYDVASKLCREYYWMLICFLKLNQVVKLKLYDGYNVDKFFFFILSSGR